MDEFQADILFTWLERITIALEQIAGGLRVIAADVAIRSDAPSPFDIYAKVFTKYELDPRDHR